MKVPFSWLKEYVDFDLSPQEISDILTLGGLEVENIEFPEPKFQGVVVAKVLSVSPHPNADKLCVAQVFDGENKHQIVCGASNCRDGMKTALARIGSVLTDAEGKSHKIKKGKLRDVESFGMLCAADELGLPGSSEGIMELPEEWPEGTELSSYYSDPVLEISLTPNLGHCQSIVGIARELAALTNLPLKKTTAFLQENGSTPVQNLIKVDLQDEVQCHRYTCRVAQNVKIVDSPFWMQQRLEACGIRSINCAVDIGNYVMLETGVPLHLFDYDAIEGKEILIASRTSHETLTTLDEKNRAIPEESLLICDRMKPLAFAGIMGGASAGISEKTRSVLIEAGLFTPQSIRRTSKRLNLRSDSSLRFERGIDPHAILLALDRAAGLLQEISDAEIAQGRIDVGQHSFPKRHIQLRIHRANGLLGIDLSPGEVSSLLKRLEMDILSETEASLEVSIPTYRNDLIEEIDLVEEVGRIYGYNNLPQYSPKHVSSMIPDEPIAVFERQMRERLIAEGLQELLTCDLISPAQSELALEKGEREDRLVHVLHPSSIDQSILRPTLLPGLLQVLKFNADRQNSHLSGFEIGWIHFKDGDIYREQPMAAIILAGHAQPYHWDPKPRILDFFDLKGILENILEAFKIPTPSFTASHYAHFHPYRQAHLFIGDVLIGVIGELHPTHQSEMDFSHRVYFAEINLHELMLLRPKDWQVSELPLFPGSERDWTIPLDASTPIEAVIQAARSAWTPLLEKIVLLDIYTSEQLGLGRKNATFRFTYRDKGKTLSIEDVEREHGKIVAAVTSALKT